MKRIFRSLMLIGLSCSAVACMEEVNVDLQVSEAEGVVFTIEDFIPEAGTKSAFQTASMRFQWSANDVIGIFPEDGWQTQFNMESGAGSNVAVFDGGSWGLKQDATYYAYYPFAHENFETMDKREQVRYSYEGQEACFADENGVVDLSKYDFMASGASNVKNGNVNFKFQHLGALCRIRFEAPATATYSHMIIEAEDAVFSFNGCYDATDKDGDGKISLMGDSNMKAQFEAPFPVSHQSFEAFQQVECYFLMPPVDLSSQKLKFKLLDTEFNYYDAVIESKNIESGMSYSWDVELDIYHAPLGQETANCYIISKSGSYSFPVVKGNGTTYVGDVASAEVLWESFGTDTAPNKGDLIAKVSYADKQISFSTTVTFQEGNAVIAAKDADGNILWSWHIWMTDKPQDQVYCNNAGIMMDRNLGATSATPGDVGALGLLYQWGRKDPFLGSSSISSRTKAKSTLNSWPTASYSFPNGTIAYATSHPTTFINYNKNNYDWYYTGDSTTDDTRWQSAKTIYDPCPVGYRVPDGNEAGVWSTAFGTSSSFNEDAFDSTNEGFDFGKSDTTKYLTEETVCWYPAAGLLDYYNGSLYSVGGGGHYWSCSPTGKTANSLNFFDGGGVNSLRNPDYDDNYRSYGRSVRCLRE